MNSVELAEHVFLWMMIVCGLILQIIVFSAIIGAM